MNLDHLIWRLENNQTAKSLCGEAATAIRDLRKQLADRTPPPQVEKALKGELP